MRKTILYNTMDTCRDKGFSGSFPRVLGHVLEDNSDLPLMEPVGGFRAQAHYRHMSDGGG